MASEASRGPASRRVTETLSSYGEADNNSFGAKAAAMGDSGQRRK